MGHRIVEAIIENGRIEVLDEALPVGKLKVHLIYDTEDVKQERNQTADSLSETSGIYKNVNGDAEARDLRGQWERDLSR
jgi:hypothetical protein